MLIHEVQGQDLDSSSLWPQGCDRRLQGPVVQLDARIERIPEDIIDVNVPRLMEETKRSCEAHSTPQGAETHSGQKRCRTCSTDIRERIGEVIQHFPQERTFGRVLEQIFDVHVPEIREQTVEVMEVIPRERVQADTEECTRFINPGARC